MKSSFADTQTDQWLTGHETESYTTGQFHPIKLTLQDQRPNQHHHKTHTSSDVFQLYSLSDS